MTKIIAFGYKKGTGKNTAAKFLDTALRILVPHLIVKNMGFAAKLKDIAFQLFKWGGLKRAVYYETHYQEKEIGLPLLNDLTPRDIWIAVGNKLRELWPSVWIDYILKGIKADIIIISDLRFQNEARAIKEAGGVLVRINREGLPQGTDPAEIDLDYFLDWDHIINNDGDLEDLNTKIEKLVQEILPTGT